MTRRLLVPLGGLVLAIAACGGGDAGAFGNALPGGLVTPGLAGACLANDPDCNDIRDPNAQTDGSDEPARPSTTLSVTELIAAGTIEGPFVVSGFLFIEANSNVVLCEVIAESYPPQCGGQSIKIAGDIPIEALTTDQGVSWSDNSVELEGTFDGTTFSTA